MREFHQFLEQLGSKAECYWCEGRRIGIQSKSLGFRALRVLRVFRGDRDSRNCLGFAWWTGVWMLVCIRGKEPLHITLKPTFKTSPVSRRPGLYAALLRSPHAVHLLASSARRGMFAWIPGRPYPAFPRNRPRTTLWLKSFRSWRKPADIPLRRRLATDKPGPLCRVLVLAT